MTPKIIPISDLKARQVGWMIKARVTKKQELHRYNNVHGKGKVFSFDLLDLDGGEIRAICFNATVDVFYDQIVAGNVYLISRASVRPAQKEYNPLGHDYEILLHGNSKVQLCNKDDGAIPLQRFRFRTIRDVGGMKNNEVVDIIGVVFSVSLAGSIKRKNDTEIFKRSLHLKDMSGRNVELTLWGAFCNNEGQKLQALRDSGEFPVLAVKSGRVSEFSGKEVGTISSTQLFINPNFPEAHRLKEWFESEGMNTPSVSIARGKSSPSRIDQRKTISQIKDERLGASEKPDWITVVATVAFINLDNFCYTACPIMDGDLQCNKKVTKNGDGKWRCDKCDRLVDECDYRYILQFQIQDHTGVTGAIAFQECGEDLMGVSAKDLYSLKCENHNVEKFREIIHRVMFNKYIFTLKVKEETFNDEHHVKSTVVKAENVKFSAEARYLLDLINKTKANDSRPFASKVETNTPTSQSGQYGNRDSGHRLTEVASSLEPFCNSCKVASHSSTNCPTIMNGPVNTNRVSFGASVVRTSDECYKCHQIGHWAKDCPRSVLKVTTNTLTSQYGQYGNQDSGHRLREATSSLDPFCNSCKVASHSSSNCPTIMNGSVNTNRVSFRASVVRTSDECYKCHHIGHWAKDCPRSVLKVETNTPTGQNGQYGNQDSGHRLREAASSLDPFCNSCEVASHSSTNSPTIMNGSVNTNRVSSGESALRTSDECYKCHQIGHWAKDCPRSWKL